MKTNELMIGDWVQDLSPVIIDAISNEDICTYQCKDGYITVNPSNLKPIPLTPEILEKNGWQCFNGSPYSVYQLKTQGGYISLYNCIKGHFEIQISGLWFKIQFVHELQHALRLCGIEKEIEL